MEIKRRYKGVTCAICRGKKGGGESRAGNHKTAHDAKF